VSVVEGFFRFWYDFIVGDDWKIAAAVATTLALGALAAYFFTDTSWLPPVAAVALALAFAISFLVDVKRHA
jgi:hypothetical protein